MSDTITNKGGRFVSATGRGVLAFRLRAMIVGLEFRRKTGMNPPGVHPKLSMIKLVQAETGLSTRNYDVLKAALEAKLMAIINECEVKEGE